MFISPWSSLNAYLNEFVTSSFRIIPQYIACSKFKSEVILKLISFAVFFSELLGLEEKEKKLFLNKQTIAVR